jgi:hypothetical protein
MSMLVIRANACALAHRWFQVAADTAAVEPLSGEAQEQADEARSRYYWLVAYERARFDRRVGVPFAVPLH